jgi:ABC-type cobalamin/Fe3+-siderophores transport system ATPase subunit
MNVSQLSDGQRHTILLTVAMLSESYVPLVIDQPEDDLDNAFISSTVVSVLREVKQRRQVIAVTHNANIAVLGDSELLFPMERRGTTATCVDQGSIDRLETREQVQKVLEGGRAAFVRRAELYNIR